MSVAPIETEIFYFRENGDEADFVLAFDASNRWMIEVKYSGDKGVSNGFFTAAERVEPERRFVIHAGPERFSRNGLDYLCLPEAMKELKSIA